MKTVEPGETVSFKRYVFGSNTSVKVVNVSAPEGWHVNVTPGRVNFPVKKNYRYIQTDEGYRKAASLTVTAAIPWNATNGAHEITVLLQEHTQGNMTGTRMTVKQMQDFQFTAAVTGSIVGDGQTVESGKQGDQNSVAETGLSQAKQAETNASKSASQETTTAAASMTEKHQGYVVSFLVFQAVWVATFLYLRRR